MKNENLENINNDVFMDENGNPIETQYVDEFGNPIDPSLIDENGNYIGETATQYVDEFGNPIDPSLIDENGNYIGETVYVDESGNSISNDVQSSTMNGSDLAQSLNVASDIESLDGAELVISAETAPISAAAHQMDDKELLTGMVTFDYNNVPITDIVNSIILDAINKGASDIHFDPFEDGIKIRLRVDGQLNDYSIVPLYVKKNMITRVKIISGMNITESRTPQDGAIRTELQNKTIDLRVSCLPTNMGEKIVVRIMDYSMSAHGVEALDFSKENLDKVNRMLALPNGIILVTGATGSGKSTTVYSMLQKLNVEGTNLVTVEDPIEMNIGGINQVQAVSEIGLTFATVLRSVLRQDPDVIMIGEIRDDETARIAVRASITGHLVLSTLHTNNSLSTIERLSDMSVERYLLGSALSGIVSQKLSRRLCPKCKRLRATTEYEKEIFKKALDKDVEEIYEPVGCPECSRGYRGRIAIHEVLLVTQQIKDAIINNVDKATLRHLVYGDNNTETMLQDGLTKVISGDTSFEEVLKLIDLDDDLGSGTQFGMNEQLNASLLGTSATNANQPQININLTPDMFAGANFQLPANFTPNMAQPMYVPYPVAAEGEEEIVIKPVKKKRTVVEIDPTELAEMMEDTDVETLEDEIVEDKVSDLTEEQIDEILELQEAPATQEAKNELKELLDEIYNLLEKLHSTKKIIGKKKFNLKVQEIVSDIEPLFIRVKDIDQQFRFNESTENDVKDLLNGILFNIQMLKNDNEIELYKKTIKRINEVLGIISEDQDLDTVVLESKLTEEELDAMMKPEEVEEEVEELEEDIELVDIEDEEETSTASGVVLVPLDDEEPEVEITTDEVIEVAEDEDLGIELVDLDETLENITEEDVFEDLEEVTDEEIETEDVIEEVQEEDTDDEIDLDIDSSDIELESDDDEDEFDSIIKMVEEEFPLEEDEEDLSILDVTEDVEEETTLPVTEEIEEIEETTEEVTEDEVIEEVVEEVEEETETEEEPLIELELDDDDEEEVEIEDDAMKLEIDDDEDEIVFPEVEVEAETEEEVVEETEIEEETTEEVEVTEDEEEITAEENLDAIDDAVIDALLSDLDALTEEDE